MDTTITFWGHASVAVQKGTTRVVIDPGVFSDPRDLEAADAILITHSHGDHLDATRVVRALAELPELAVYGPASVAADLRAAGAPDAAVHVVEAGDQLRLGVVDVRVIPMPHAAIHADIGSPANVGYLLDGEIFHPGDSLVPPDLPVDVLLLPIAAPWMTLGDGVAFLRAVQPRIAIPIHDAILSDAGVAVWDGLLGMVLEGVAYRRLAVGASIAP
jgi:L-ascorbate metabolism protein UlaG (beta-lactamase superfamily)